MQLYTYRYRVVVFFLIASLSCNETFLEITPKGSLDASVLATKEGINALLIGAYAMLDGVSSNGLGWEAASSNWIYGSIRGMEANKGSDPGDKTDLLPIQSYRESATNAYIHVKWKSVYEGISRCNEALKALLLAEERNEISDADADSFRRQLRTLRGFFHFEAWRMWEKICYIDENTDLTTITNQGDNRAQILDDLEAGIALPNNMDFVGRFNGTVARVLFAKAQMQMYQNYAAATSQLEWVLANGTAPDGHAIGLESKYGDVFDAANRNGMESIYTIQYSVNDGSGGWNGGWGEVLNFPYKPEGASPAGCCGYFQPSHDLVNSFLTTDGLPLLDGSHSQNPVFNDMGVNEHEPFTPEDRPLDPRLDWTVGRRGIPYLDWGTHTGKDWIRDQFYGGPYSPKKQVYRKSQEGILTETGSWTKGFTANGYRLIRFADVLLLFAECSIELNDLELARAQINLVRTRAANPMGFVKDEEGSDAAHYQVSEYPASGYPFDTQENARKALRMERKLELGMEGHRFFDLQRWGNVESELNSILNYERTELQAIYSGSVVGPEDVLFPIPQQEIDLMGGRLVQNR